MLHRLAAGACAMGQFGPVHWVVIAIVVLLLFEARQGRARVKFDLRRFLHGMTVTSALALGGAALLALALLTDVYDIRWSHGATPNLATDGLAGSGALLVLAAVVSALRAGKRS